MPRKQTEDWITHRVEVEIICKGDYQIKTHATYIYIY